MKITKIFAENIKTFPRLDLHLEDYKVALVTGPNGAGKTTAFVTIPTLSFYGESQGHTIKDYSLPAKESKIGIEFEYDSEKYVIVRQYYGESSKSVLINVSQNKRITKAKEIEQQVERLFGMDRHTFLSTVVIAQGEVETLSERPPRERRELFLKFLDVDFKKAYEKAKESLSETESKLRQVDGDISQLELELEEKPQIEKRIPEIESEINKLESELSMESQKKNALLVQRDQVGDELGKLREYRRQLELLIDRRALLKKDTEDFSKRIAGMKKEEIETLIHEVEDKLRKIQETYQIVQQRDILSAKLTLLQDIVKTRKNYIEPAKVDEKIRQAKEYKKTKEDEKSQLESRKTELMTRKDAASIYMASIEKYSTCPVCDTQLSRPRQIEVINKIENEVKSIPSEVMETDRRIRMLEEEIEKTDKEVTSLIQQLAESKAADAKLQEYLTKVDAKYRDQPEQAIEEVEDALNDTKRRLEENMSVLGLELPASMVDGATLSKRHLELSEEKTVLQKSYAEYGRFEDNMEEIKKIDRELKPLDQVEKEIEDKTRSARQLQDDIRKLDDEISALNRRIGSKKEELSNANQRLNELAGKEKILDLKRDEQRRLSRQKDVLTIVKEEVFKDDAFPTVYLREFVRIVQANLSDFISRFKGGRYEIDMSITDRGDIEVRARDRHKTEAEYRPLETFSQGERTIIGFAIRLATMRAISQYKGKSTPNVLIVDEGFGPLDQENIRALVDGIKELGEVFEQIFIITHIEQLKEDFDQNLIVEETPSGSIVRAA